MKTVLVLLFCASLKIGLAEGNNSTGIGNNVSGSVNSTTLPSAQVKTVVTTTIKEQDQTTTEGEHLPGKLPTGITTPASQDIENNGTTGAAVSKDDLPFWAYILIACAIVVVLGAIAVAGFVKYDRWKNQGSYMVWDSGELQLSPAFISRESEFLIDNLAAEQEPGSPELQLYEIPLDSLGHQRVCIGAKRVAPRRQTHSSKNTKLLKDRSKKDGQQFQVHTNTLPRLGKRDQMYSAANNGVNSALSEGDISEDRMNSNITFTKMTLRSGKNGSKPLSLGSIGRSGSTHLFQNRPLPAAPSKRFSKSLDRLRFLELFPNSKHSKAATVSAHTRPLPRLPSHPSLIKSMSCGTNLHQMIANAKDRPGSPPDIKSSLDFQEQLDTSRKSMISHRHSKSLDTLLLLKELDWMSFEIDINHSYESMHRSKNEMEDSPYASVETSNQTSPRCSDHKSSLSTSLRGSQSPSDGENCDENEEHPYASVSEEESWSKGGLTKSPLHFKRKPSNATLSPSVSSEDAMPYASVRISQIPGIGPSHDYSSQGDTASCPGEVFEDSGSSLEAAALSVEGTDSTRPVSTATYLEILPDHTRASMISETSSGYARPIDLRPHDVEPQDGNDTDPPEKCNSLTELMVPVVETLPSTINHHDNQDSDICVPMGPPAYTCENSNQKPFDSEMEHESDICVNKTDEEPERHATGNKDDPSADISDKDSAAVFENAAFVDSLVSEDSYL